MAKAWVIMPVRASEADMSAGTRRTIQALYRSVQTAIPDQGDAIADLDLTIANPPTQGQVQEISNKVDEILAFLRAQKAIAT